MCRMKFMYTVKTLQWFLLYRDSNYDDSAAIQELMKLIRKRAKQLHEMDVVLFDGMDLPVMIPSYILDQQKSLTKKTNSPSKRKQ